MAHSEKKFSFEENIYRVGGPSIDLDTILSDLLHQWWVILLTGIMFALFTGAYLKYTYVPEYSARTTFVVSTSTVTNNIVADDLSASSTITDTFRSIVDSNIMKKRVMSDLELTAYDVDVTLTKEESTNLMTMVVTGYDPREIWCVSRSILDHATEIASSLQTHLSVVLLEEPSIPTCCNNPLSTSKPMRLAFLVGILLMTGIFVSLSCMNDTVKNTAEFHRKVDGTLLGTIPHEKKAKTLRSIKDSKKVSLCIDNPMLSFGYVEAVRLMSTRVRKELDKLSDSKEGKVLMVTSVSENEGKSTVAANLALSLSEEGHRVWLLDCDFRKPSQYMILDVPKENITVNLAEALKNNTEIQCTDPGKKRLIHAVLSCGSNGSVINRESREVLLTVLNKLRKEADYVIIDTSPLGLVAEGERIAGLSDACLLVVEQNTIVSTFINDTLDQLAETGVKVIGCVFNNVRTGLGKQFAELGTYGYGYGGYHYNRRYGSYYGRYGKYGKYGRYDKVKNSEKEADS